MSIEQRVVAEGRRNIGTGGDDGSAPSEVSGSRSRKRSAVVLVVVGVVVAAVAAWVLFFRSAPAEARHEPEPVVLGEVQPVESVSLNLADGRYLRLGIALQLTADAHGEVDTARALDQAIALFSGRDIASVSDPAVRDQLKGELAAQLAQTYHGEVVDVYLTEYVTQ